MDILNKALDIIQAELGFDVFTDEKREWFERHFRMENGGQTYHLGTVHALNVAERHREARRLIRQGLENTLIAERVGLTRQQVWNIRSEMTVKQS